MSPTTIQPILKAPGSKHYAAPGIPDHIRSLARLMDMEFLWVKQKGFYIATVRDRSPASKFQEHMFEANPKLLTNDEAWMEFMKQVADFMADRGATYKMFYASLKTSLDRLSATPENENGSTEEQTPTVGGPDSSGGAEHPGASTPGGDVPPGSARPASTGPADAEHRVAGSPSD